VRHEADDRVCDRLAAMLPGVPTALARIDDPALYKAVAGQLQLMVSARMHPMILAAGMGVPVVGLAYNGKFGGFFELLGLPPRFAWLDEIGPHGSAEDLESLFAGALADAADIGQRARALADRSAAGAAALLQQAGLA
jgi:polysaccharide pyruvyl transferase WcaK-like protein